MVAALAMFPNPSSSLSQLLIPPTTTTTTFQSPVASFPTFHLHGCFKIIKFSLTRNTELKLVLVPISFRPSKHVLIRCSRHIISNSSSNPITETELLFSLFQEIGVDESEAQLLLHNNPAIKLTSFESIRARVLSLQSLGINGFPLYRLITKCPDVLTAEEIDELICFIRDGLEGKIEPARLHRLLMVTEPRFFVGFDKKVRLLLHQGIPQEKIAHVLNNVNLTKALCLKPTEEIERTINFLNRFGGVDIIVRRPAILNYDLETQLIPRIGFLNELSGGDEDATGSVLRKLPAVLSYSLEHLESHIEFLRLFAGLSDEQIFKIVVVFPNVFSASRKRKLHPRIDFLKQCWLNSDDIFRFLIKAPLFLGLSYEENLSYKLGCLVKIGYEYRTKELAMAMGAVTRTSCENLQKVIGLFLSYGFSCEDIVSMSKKHPQILQYNPGSLKGKMDYLIEEMGRETRELLAFPAFLGYKLDDRIKHRYEVKKKIIGEGMSLNKLLTVSTERFLKKGKKKLKKSLVYLNDNPNGREG